MQIIEVWEREKKKWRKWFHCYCSCVYKKKGRSFFLWHTYIWYKECFIHMGSQCFLDILFGDIWKRKIKFQTQLDSLLLLLLLLLWLLRCSCLLLPLTAVFFFLDFICIPDISWRNNAESSERGNGYTISSSCIGKHITHSV